jgi:type IV pilus assembly protein PilB
MRLFTRLEGSAGPTSEAIDPEMKSSIAEAIAQAGAIGDAAFDDTTRVIEGAPIVRLVNTIIQQAVQNRASDIHLEPERKEVRIRYRIDGVLHETMRMPKYIQMPLTERFKVVAEMDLTERRLPQTGRIGINYEGTDYALRVFSLPTLHGEKIVVRFLDSRLVGMEELGFTSETQAQLEALIQQPGGLLLVVGPSGSGKTTTLYDLLNKLNTVEKNIVAVGDMCEYQLDGITQVLSNVKAGLSLAAALQAALYERPDVILIEPLCNPEVLQIALSAAEAGHLVLGSLLANDAPSALLRLTQMGADPTRVAASVLGVLAQRLVRRVCADCKETCTVAASELKAFGFKPEDPTMSVELARGVGCEACRNTGFKGRIGVHELLCSNVWMAETIARGASYSDLKGAAKMHGMHELREDGLLKVLESITTPDEVERLGLISDYRA